MFYRNLLFIGFDERGIHLSTLFLFRLSHKPILIPWREVGVPRSLDPFEGRTIVINSPKNMWMAHLVFPIGNPVLTTLSLPVVWVNGTPLDPATRS